MYNTNTPPPPGRTIGMWRRNGEGFRHRGLYGGNRIGTHSGRRPAMSHVTCLGKWVRRKYEKLTEGGREGGGVKLGNKKSPKSTLLADITRQ